MNAQQKKERKANKKKVKRREWERKVHILKDFELQERNRINRGERPRRAPVTL